jgi:hypothetical protein
MVVPFAIDDHSGSLTQLTPVSDGLGTGQSPQGIAAVDYNYRRTSAQGHNQGAGSHILGPSSLHEQAARDRRQAPHGAPLTEPCTDQANPHTIPAPRAHIKKHKESAIT